MSKLTAEQIENHAEKLQKTEVGLSNYTQVFNDVCVLIRELARNVKELTEKKE